MAYQDINTGTPNQKDGDKLRNAFVKVKDMFIELYSLIKTNTSQLVNDGENGTDPFITAQDINNFSKTIFVTSTDIEAFAGSTVEEQIVNYINSLNYNKQETDSDVWIDYTEIQVINNAFDGMLTIS